MISSTSPAGKGCSQNVYKEVWRSLSYLEAVYPQNLFPLLGVERSLDSGKLLSLLGEQKISSTKVSTMKRVKANALVHLYKQLKMIWSPAAVPARECSLATCTRKSRNDARECISFYQTALGICLREMQKCKV